MTAEYRTAQKIREALEREYALLSYRLPYMRYAGYSRDEEQRDASDATIEQAQEQYKVKAIYPIRQYQEP